MFTKTSRQLMLIITVAASVLFIVLLWNAMFLNQLREESQFFGQPSPLSDVLFRRVPASTQPCTEPEESPADSLSGGPG